MILLDKRKQILVRKRCIASKKRWDWNAMQCKIVLANSFTKRQNETEPFTQRVYFLYTLYFSKSIKGTECNLSQSVREKEKQEYFCLALSYFLLVKIQPIRSSIPIFLVYRILSLEDHPISNGMQTSLYMELER